MTEIITNPFYRDFMTLCSEAQTNIKLCAPYVKTDVISDVLKIARVGISVDMITKVNLRDYHSNASDLESVRQALVYGGQVYNCSNLHAKVYIFDARKCVITSANLTKSGLNRNAECGIVTENADIVASALEFYTGIIMREDVGKIDERIVGNIADLLQHLPPVKPITYPCLDIAVAPDDNLLAITNRLTGWKRDVFLSIGQFGESFSSAEVGVMAQQLHVKYPRNNNREAKIRQILQQLRDLGLVEFSSPGVYKKLWI